MRPRAASRSSMSGASWPATAECTAERALLLASLAASVAWRSVGGWHGSRGWRAKIIRSSHRWLIATFHRDAPARCGAFGVERRIVAGAEGAECVIDERARSWPRRPQRAFRRETLAGTWVREAGA